MDKLVLTDTGGFPLKLDDLLWMDGRLDTPNKGMYDAIQAHLLAYGTDYIVEGCAYSAPDITAGWIMFGGELMRVDAHAGTDDFFVRTVTFDARGDKTFKDTTVNSTYEKIRGVLSGASGSLNITTADRLEDKIIQLLATSAEQFVAGNIPNLDATKITTGVLDRNTTGNATTATTATTANAWTTGRTLTLSGDATGNTGAFDGSGAISLAVVVVDDSHAHTGSTISGLAAGDTTSGIFAAARLPDASQSAKGIQENANTTEAQALSSTTLTMTPGTLADVNGGLLTTIVDIDDWDMSSATGTSSTVVAHGLADFKKIRSIQAMIRNDLDTTIAPLTSLSNSTAGTDMDGGIRDIDSTNITLIRITGADYDAAGFSTTPYNRGFVIIQYLP